MAWGNKRKKRARSYDHGCQAMPWPCPMVVKPEKKRFAKTVCFALARALCAAERAARGQYLVRCTKKNAITV